MAVLDFVFTVCSQDLLSRANETLKLLGMYLLSTLGSILHESLTVSFGLFLISLLQSLSTTVLHWSVLLDNWVWIICIARTPILVGCRWSLTHHAETRSGS